MLIKVAKRWLLTTLFVVCGCADLGEPPLPREDETTEASESPAQAEQALTEFDGGLRVKLCAGPLGLTCGAGEYCATAYKGSCPSETTYGACRPRPQICTKEFRPVCGCNGQTFPNACVAAAAGVAVRAEGACAPSGPFCGGIAGIDCPGEGRCVDDPSDDCDPKNGGADCGGICTCRTAHTCPVGSHFDSNPNVCRCVRDACPTNPCAATLCAVGNRCVVRDCKAFCEPIGPGCQPCPPGQLCTDVVCPLETTF